MQIKKGVFISTLIGCFLIGGIIGFYADHYYYITKPQKIAMVQANKQQEALNKMVRKGKIAEVKPSELTVEVKESGIKDVEGKAITVSITPETNIQMGNSLINNGTVIDLTQYLKKDMNVDLLVDEQNKAVVVHWEAPEQGKPGQ